MSFMTFTKGLPFRKLAIKLACNSNNTYKTEYFYMYCITEPAAAQNDLITIITNTFITSLHLGMKPLYKTPCFVALIFKAILEIFSFAWFEN